MIGQAADKTFRPTAVIAGPSGGPGEADSETVQESRTSASLRSR